MAMKITDRDEEIVEMYVGGMKVAAICAEAGVQPQVVYMALRKLGVEPNRRDRDGDGDGDSAKPGTPERYELLIDDPDFQRVLALYNGEEGLTIAEIARRTGIGYGRVRAMLKEARVPLQPGRRSINGRSLNRRIMEYVLKHPEAKVGEIAVFFGQNPALVGKIMRKMGHLQLKFEHTESGKLEAIIEEVTYRLGGELPGKPWQPKLPGL